MTTLKDIARQVGVSMSTVSAVLNDKRSTVPISDKTRKRILKVADELNYYPNIFARSLRTRMTGIVAIIVTDIRDPYFDSIIDGAEQILEENGYYFILITARNSPSKEKLYLNKLHRSRVDGLLIMSAVIRFTNNMLRELSASKVPTVLVARKAPNQDINSVELDNFKGGFLATEHLISLGHSEIIHMTTSYKRIDAQARLNGYRKAMKKHGLEGKCRIVRSGDTPESGYETMAHVIRRGKRPTAIFAFNDQSAFGVIKASKNSGLRVPQDIAVVGFDDIPHSAHFCPSLTTIHQPSTEMGKTGAELLLKAVQKRDTSAGKHVVFSPELIVRESSMAKQS